MIKKLLLLVFVTVIIITSCKKEQPVKDYQIISGKIENYKKRSVELIGHNYSKRIKFDRKSKTFSDTLRNVKSGHYILKVGKRPIPLYLSDTTNTNLTVDARRRTSEPVFNGNFANIDKYLSKRRKKFSSVLGNAKKFFGSEADEFLTKNKEYKNTLLKLAENSSLPMDYIEKEKRNIQYEYTRNLYNYQKFHRILTGDYEYEVPENFPNEVENVDFNNSEDYLNFKDYRYLLKEYIEDKAERKTPEGGDPFLTHIETIQTEVNDTLIKNDLLHIVSDKALTYTDNLSEFYEKYMAFSTSEKNKKQITDSYNKLKLVAKGNPSPKFKDYKNYDGGTTSLDDLIGKGKYLYIDIWATWCGFCKKEIPLLKNFEVKYHGKDIEFVSINVDTKNKEKIWRKTIKDKEMGGIQLFAGNNERTLQFTKDYLVKGLPRFIILDPDGKIVSWNAPRPSDGEKLEDIFAELGVESH